MLPLTYLVDIVQGIVYEGKPIWEQPGSVAVLLAWGIAGTLDCCAVFRLGAEGALEACRGRVPREHG